MSFVEAKEEELGKALDGEWRTCNASPEATERDPFGAWIEVVEVVDGGADVQPLRLRLVRDRGEDHVDVWCVDDRSPRRWVPLEIVAVAADAKRIQHYLRAFKATLTAGTEEDNLPESARMLGDPVKFIAKHKPSLVQAAESIQAIRRAETLIAGKTTALLEATATSQ